MSDKKRGIAIIEDSEIHARWLKERLRDHNTFDVLSIDHLGLKGIESVRKLHPVMVLLDFQLSDITGLEVAKRIKAHLPDIKIFALTAHTENAIIERMISDKNLDAIVIKGSIYFEENFVAIINRVIEGRLYLDPSLLGTLRGSSQLNQLTKREFEIFIQSHTGKTDHEIADNLSVALSHVRNLKSRITKKTEHDDLKKLLEKLIKNARA